jgi:hypothetical protein
VPSGAGLRRPKQPPPSGAAPPASRHTPAIRRRRVFCSRPCQPPTTGQPTQPRQSADAPPPSRPARASWPTVSPSRSPAIRPTQGLLLQALPARGDRPADTACAPLTRPIREVCARAGHHFPATVRAKAASRALSCTSCGKSAPGGWPTPSSALCNVRFARFGLRFRPSAGPAQRLPPLTGPCTQTCARKGHARRPAEPAWRELGGPSG